MLWMDIRRWGSKCPHCKSSQGGGGLEVRYEWNCPLKIWRNSRNGLGFHKHSDNTEVLIVNIAHRSCIHDVSDPLPASLATWTLCRVWKLGETEQRQSMHHNNIQSWDLQRFEKRENLDLNANQDFHTGALCCSRAPNRVWPKERSTVFYRPPSFLPRIEIRAARWLHI